MRTIYKIARTELQTLFYSPIAWLILVIFAFQAAMLFAGMLTGIVEGQTMGYKYNDITSYIFSNLYYGVFPMIQSYLYLYIPLLTMGLMSRELGSGSITLLYSSPVTNTQIILGKFLSMMIYGLILVGMLFVFVLFGMATIKDFDFPAVLAALFGLYLLICAYSSVGLFMSSLTSYQIVAAILTLCMLAFLDYIRGVGQSFAFVREVTYWLGISGRAEEFVNGLICSEDLLYFIIVSGMFLALTVIRLQACRQKSPFSVTFGKYLGVLLVVCILGYISSRPMFMCYYDATSTKKNTLTQNSQDVVSCLDGKLTITTYVNLLDTENSWYGMPEEIKNDQARFKQYVRFKPETELKYVYYYDTVANEGWEKFYPGMNTKQIASELFKVYKLDSTMFLTPEQIRARVDLSAEGNTFVRLLERENGEKTFLRIYRDFQIFPTEQEITAAMKRIAMKLPNVGFLTGHGERDNKRVGDRDYNSFALDRNFRYALINQGFDVVNVNLLQEIPEDIKILVIAEMREPMTASEKVNLDKYIERGGNLLIMSEPKRSGVMTPLLAQFGVSLVPGILVRQTENFSPDLVVSSPTKGAADLVYTFDAMFNNEYVTTMPGVSGLEYSIDKGYTVIPLFMTDSLTWNELETTNFVDDKVILNAEAGEVQKAYTTALALCRNVGGKKQKIMIFGDADCISNAELAISRPDIDASNFSIITSSFFWMSDGEVPIDMRRPVPTDDQVYINKAAMSVWAIVWRWIFPALLVAMAVLIWIRRRGR